jgi:hypothetical protein
VYSRDCCDWRLFWKDLHQRILSAFFVLMTHCECREFELRPWPINQGVHDPNISRFDPSAGSRNLPPSPRAKNQRTVAKSSIPTISGWQSRSGDLPPAQPDVSMDHQGNRWLLGAHGNLVLRDARPHAIADHGFPIRQVPLAAQPPQLRMQLIRREKFDD